MASWGSLWLTFHSKLFDYFQPSWVKFFSNNSYWSFRFRIMRVRKSAEAEVDYFSSFSAPDIPLMKLTRRRSLPKAPPLRRKYSRPSLDTDNIPRNSVGYNPGPDSDYITYYNTLYNARSNLQNPRSSMEKTQSPTGLAISTRHCRIWRRRPPTEYLPTCWQSRESNTWRPASLTWRRAERPGWRWWTLSSTRWPDLRPTSQTLIRSPLSSRILINTNTCQEISEKGGNISRRE